MKVTLEFDLDNGNDFKSLEYVKRQKNILEILRALKNDLLDEYPGIDNKIDAIFEKNHIKFNDIWFVK